MPLLSLFSKPRPKPKPVNHQSEYNPVLGLQLLDLPSELLVQILSYIPFPAILSCCTISRAFNTLISLSSLQYVIALQYHGLTDNPSCTLSPAERLRFLNAREHAWRFNPVFKQNVPLHPDHHASWIQDLVDGVYLLGDTVTRQKVIAGNASTIWGTRALRCRVLPSPRHDHNAWSYFDPGMAILNVAMAIQPNDLIAIVTTKPDTVHPDSHSLVQIHLLQFSTGNPHPNATLHPLAVTRSKIEAGRPVVTVHVLGHYIAILLAHGPYIFDLSDNFYLFDWKTGILILSFQFPLGTYHSFVFLTPQTLLFPNVATGALDILHIRDSTPTNKPFSHGLTYSLSLPRLKHAFYYSIIWAHAEPKPKPDPTSPDFGNPLSTSPGYHQKPFHTSPAHSLLLFHIGVQKVVNNGSWGTNGMRVYTLFVHRQSLLALDPSSLPSSSTSPGRTPRPVVVVPWKSWGPPCTRWLDAHDVPTRLTNTSAGQRHVRITPDGRIHVLDFNPWHVRRELAGVPQGSVGGGGGGGGGGGRGGGGGSGGMVRVMNMRTALESGGQRNPWRRKVYSELPYVLTTSVARFPYCAVVMDEERIVGFEMDYEDDRITGMEVLHFG